MSQRTVTIKLVAQDWEIDELKMFLERILRVFLPDVETEVTEGDR